jgi:hypothetical protein
MLQRACESGGEKTPKIVFQLPITFNPLKPRLYKYYLRIQSALQREHHTLPLQTSTG